MSLIGEGISVVHNNLSLPAKFALVGAIVLAGAEGGAVSCLEPDDWHVALPGVTTEHTGFAETSIGQMPY